MLVGETNARGESAWVAVSAAPDWREVDRRLRGIARRRGELDREELVALRDAIRVQVWREVGCASMREYLERIFGYGPRAASDRLRVAAALHAMPALEEALDAGELAYSGVREIARVATSRTAGAWVDACRGKCLREIEELVAQHAPGDEPDSPPRGHERPQVLRLELEGSDYALWRQARQIVEGERDEAVTDRELFAAVCTALIERARESVDSVEVRIDTSTDGRAHVGSDADLTERAHVGSDADLTERAHVGSDADLTERAHVRTDADSTELAHVGHEGAAIDRAEHGLAPTDHIDVDGDAAVPGQVEVDRGGHPKRGTQRLGSEAQRGRAKYQIAILVCEGCGRGWQEGGGKRIPISAADVARAECDAQRVGSLDGDPANATQDIAPKTRRFVWRRDGDRCTVPGCRSSSFLEVHHIVHRENGGGHEPENLTLLCGGHHDAHHNGRLVIRGRAPDLTFVLAGERLERPMSAAHVGASAPRAQTADRLRDETRQMRADAVLALHTLGFKKPEAVAVVDAALVAANAPVDLETLLRLALQRCPR
jgi:hypothetical protein